MRTAPVCPDCERPLVPVRGGVACGCPEPRPTPEPDVAAARAVAALRSLAAANRTGIFHIRADA